MHEEESIWEAMWQYMSPKVADDKREPKHLVIYRLRCRLCGHQWEDTTGWLPRACTKCGNVIEYGDHLPAHLEIISVRFARESEALTNEHLG